MKTDTKRDRVSWTDCNAAGRFHVYGSKGEQLEDGRECFSCLRCPVDTIPPAGKAPLGVLESSRPQYKAAFTRARTRAARSWEKMGWEVAKGDCPECGSLVLRREATDKRGQGRWTCSNYGGCENAPG